MEVVARSNIAHVYNVKLKRSVGCKGPHEEKQSDVSVPTRLMCLIEALGVMMRRLADFLQPQRLGSK